jgi:hypothetical protein
VVSVSVNRDLLVLFDLVSVSVSGNMDLLVLCDLVSVSVSVYPDFLVLLSQPLYPFLLTRTFWFSLVMVSVSVTTYNKYQRAKYEVTVSVNPDFPVLFRM